MVAVSLVQDLWIPLRTPALGSDDASHTDRAKPND